MIFIFLGFIFIFLISLICTKDFFHPAVVISLLWLAVIFLYYIFTEKYEMKPLSTKTAVLFLLWSFGFSFSSLIFSNKKYCISWKLKEKPNFSFMRFIYPFIIFSNIVFLFLIFALLGNGFSLTSFSLIRKNFVENIPLVLKIFYFINTLSVSYYFLCLIFYGRILTKRKFFLLSCLLLILSIMKMTKTVFFMILFAILIILRAKGKLNFKKIIGLAMIFSFFIIGLALLRGDSGSIQDFTIQKYIVWYLCSSVAGINTVIADKIPLPNSTFGGHVFRFLYAILGLLGINFENTGFYGPWIYVPFPTNVYTVVAPYYVDFGMIGVFVFSIIVGSWYGYIYSFVKRKIPLFIVYYAVLFYTLIMEFFSDYHFYTFTLFIQYFVFLVIFYISNKKLKYIFTLM